jgi:hypothetical protein
MPVIIFGSGLPLLLGVRGNLIARLGGFDEVGAELGRAASESREDVLD